MLEKKPSLANAAKTALAPGQGSVTASSDYRRPSRFADAPPPPQEMPDKRSRGFPDAPLRSSGPTDNRSSFQGYGQTANSGGLAQSAIGDFRGLQEKMQSLYPGSQPTGGAGEDTHTAQMPPFSQSSPGGMTSYARPPPPSSVAQAAFGMSGPHWANTNPLASSNGRQDWRPGFGGPSGQMSDYHNPMQQQQQRLQGNWQADRMPFGRFH